MIVSLNGTLLEKHLPPDAKALPYLRIECAGVGYHVTVTQQLHDAVPDVGQPIFILTECIIREDSHTLYGFSHATERALFNHLLSIKGIGPKVAMAMMNRICANELNQAIVNQDSEKLASLPNIGKKTAQRIILELGNKLTSSVNVDADNNLQLSLALAHLGYTKKEIAAALAKMSRDGQPIEQQIRQALKILSG